MCLFGHTLFFVVPLIQVPFSILKFRILREKFGSSSDNYYFCSKKLNQKRMI